MADVTIAKDVVDKYETKDVISFVVKKLKQYNRNTEEKHMDMELQLYIEILSALDDKMHS